MLGSQYEVLNWLERSVFWGFPQTPGVWGPAALRKRPGEIKMEWEKKHEAELDVL